VHEKIASRVGIRLDLLEVRCAEASRSASKGKGFLEKNANSTVGDDCVVARGRWYRFVGRKEL